MEVATDEKARGSTVEAERLLLPEGWCWARIDGVAAVNPSTNFDALDPKSEIPFVPMAAVAEEAGTIDLTARRQVSDVAKGYVRFAEGDVIFAKITPCMENGKVAPVVGVPGGFAAGSTEFHIFRPFAVEQRYLWYCLIARSFRGRAKRNMSGSAGQLRVPVDWLREVRIPIAPRSEQRRIVARIDALFAEIAEGEAALAEARKGLETFRRALLKAAVTGELTKDWRRANGHVQTTAHDLLSRIARDRAARKPAKTHRQSVPIPLDVSELPELPAGWTWSPLANLSSLVIDGDHNPPKRVPQGIPHLTAKNIKQGKVTLEGCSFVSEEGYRQTASRYTPVVGDILITCVGTLGEIAIFKRADRVSIDRNIAAVRLEDGINREFVELSLNSPNTAAEMRRASGSTAQPHLYLKEIRAINVAVPPPDEAEEIVRRVADALTISADTLALLDAEAADAARLKQSILKAAFEGRLVPQDPTDEPASSLLARVADQSEVQAKRGLRKAARAKNLATQ